jgi:hypothetical protein
VWSLWRKCFLNSVRSIIVATLLTYWLFSDIVGHKISAFDIRPFWDKWNVYKQKSIMPVCVRNKHICIHIHHPSLYGRNSFREMCSWDENPWSGISVPINSSAAARVSVLIHVPIWTALTDLLSVNRNAIFKAENRYKLSFCVKVKIYEAGNGRICTHPQKGAVKGSR